MLHIEPAAVALSRAVVGDTRPLPDILPVLRERGVAAVSENGVLGDPTGANASEGEVLLETLADDLAATVRALLL
jgi:creatinine amidohydrolase